MMIYANGLMVSGQEIVHLEYFFDADPGYGNGIEIPVTPDSMIEVDINVSISDLGDGIHTLYSRTKDTLGHWSFIQKTSFLKDSIALIQNPDIVELEYFFDDDPGKGNGIDLTITTGSTIIVLDNASIALLQDGIHTIYVRAKDEYGNWSFIQKSSFLKDPNESSSPFPITNMEYFIDSDPGYGNATSVYVSDSSWISGDTTINLNSLAQGVHHMYSRSMNAAGKWSFVQKQSFLFESEYIEVAQYKFDSLPGFAPWVISDPFTPSTDIIAEIDFDGICDLDTGWYYIDARVRRMFSWWSKEKRDSIEIKADYLQTGVVIDQFGDSIPDVSIDVEGVGTFSTDSSGLYSFLVPLCWGDSILLSRDSLYSALKSCVFQNPVVDYSPHHVLGDIDSVLIGYTCVNQSGTIPLQLSYICEDATIQVSKSGEFIDTGSISGYILHDGILTLGTVFAMNSSGVFVNNGSLPQNQKLYISPVVGRPGTPLIDVNHECTDIMLPGKPVVLLNTRDTVWLQLDSTGMASILADTLLESECNSCEIENYFLSQSQFACPDFGIQTETLTVDDGNGHEASCSIIIHTGDTIVPLVTCRTDTLVYTDPGLCTFSALSDELDPVSTWDNCPFTMINSFSSTSSLEDIPIPLGAHMIQWTINDAHGNTAICSFNITVEDHESPQIICQPTPIRNTNPGTCTYTITGSELNPVSVADNCIAFTFWNDSTNTSTLNGLTLELGSHLITWIVDDHHGQFDTCTSLITVEDHEVPQITCAGNAIRFTDEDVCTYQITGAEFQPVSVTDNCTAFTHSNNLNNTTSLNGVILPLGPNEITWTVNDGHGQTASCVVTVTVQDDELPTITCALDGMRNMNPGMCDYTVVGNEFNPIAVSDNCMSFTYSNPLTNTNTLDGAELPFGPTNIIWTVNDGNGHTASCTVTVTVMDNQFPMITCPSNVTLEISSAVCDTTYFYSTLTSDNCPGIMLTLESGIGSGNPFPTGTSLEAFVAEDIGGNTAQCMFQITVNKIPDLVSDTICYGDSIFLEGEFQYLPGVFTDTFTNIVACDSIVITTLDTTTICIWPSAIVYVDSSAMGENTGVDWENAYIDLQLALDVGERYQNVVQLWVAEGTYFPTQGVNRTRSFVLVDSLIILAGFQGNETDSAARDHELFPVYLSGDIGIADDSTDNSYHVLINPDSIAGVIVDGFIIVKGTANGTDTLDQSGAGLVNYGKIILMNSRLEQCSSTGQGVLILNSGLSAMLVLKDIIMAGQDPIPLWNKDQAELFILGTVEQLSDW